MSGSRLHPGDMEARYSLHEGLPATFQEYDFTDRLVRAFDDVNAPVHTVLDDLEAYVDPRLAPDDFLGWLGGWLGIEVNRRWPAKRRREYVIKAVAAYQARGTADGIALAIELHTGLQPTVTDNGAVSASAEPMGAIPGSRDKAVVVTIQSDGRTEIDEALIDRIVTESKPPHVPHEIRIRG